MADESIPMKIKTLFSSFLAKEDVLSDKDQSQKKDLELQNRNSDQSNDARNKDLYYERVETYSALTWFAKPLQLSPLVCARYGWVNVDTDMLQCINCKTFLCASLPKRVDAFSYKESCRKLKTGLVDTHLKVCKWSKNPSPESFAMIPLYKSAELLGELMYRRECLSCMRCPDISYKSIEQHGVSKASLHDIISTIFLYRKPAEQSTTAVLALTGWSNCGSQQNLLQCCYCRRKLGLWNYKQNLEERSTEENGQTWNANNDSVNNGNNVQSCDDKDNDDEPRVKRIKLEKVDLDPVTEHRYWCPWVQLFDHSSILSTNTSPVKSLTPPHTAIATDSEKCPAWLMVAKLLSKSSDTDDNHASPIRQTTQTDSVQHVRQVLRGCTSPKAAMRLTPTASPT